jgi:hypothetical protein
MPDKSAIKGSVKLRAFRREKNTRLKAGLLDYLEGPMNAGRVIADMALTEPTEPAVLPRHIWMYWHDGWENAPDIARLCRQSWIERNPGYEVHALDYGSLSGFLRDPLVHYEATKLNNFANQARLRLLRTHGGVWADATNFCTRPIDPWIADKVSAARLFAFTLPNAERPIATWFLAATLRENRGGAHRNHNAEAHLERGERERSPAALQVLDMLRVNLGALDGKTADFLDSGAPEAIRQRAVTWLFFVAIAGKTCNSLQNNRADRNKFKKPW